MSDNKDYNESTCNTSDASPCCPDTAWGKIIEMEKEPTKGKDMTVSDNKIPAYFSTGSADFKKGIVVFPDM